MKKCHKADHRLIQELQDAYRDAVLNETKAWNQVAAVREFAWGLGASTASRADILDALTRQPFAPGGYVPGESDVPMRVDADEHLLNRAGQCVRGPHQGCSSGPGTLAPTEAIPTSSDR